MKNIIHLLILTAVFAASCGEPAVESKSVKEDSVESSSETGNPKSGEMTNKPPKGFYWNYDVPTGVEEAVDMTEEEAKKIMSELPESDGNFFGLELADGSIVQFMYDGQKETWFLDIPNPVTQESFNADVTRDEIAVIIHDVYGGASADAVKAGNPPRE